MTNNWRTWMSFVFTSNDANVQALDDEAFKLHVCKEWDAQRAAASPVEPWHMKAVVRAWHDAVNAYSNGTGTVGALMKYGADMADLIEQATPSRAPGEPGEPT